jgi:hypothetical protein
MLLLAAASTVYLTLPRHVKLISVVMPVLTGRPAALFHQ